MPPVGVWRVYAVTVTSSVGGAGTTGTASADAPIGTHPRTTSTAGPVAGTSGVTTSYPRSPSYVRLRTRTSWRRVVGAGGDHATPLVVGWQGAVLGEHVCDWRRWPASRLATSAALVGGSFVVAAQLPEAQLGERDAKQHDERGEAEPAWLAQDLDHPAILHQTTVPAARAT